MELIALVLKESTMKSHDQIDLVPKASNLVDGQSNTQVIAPVVDDLGLLARKTFSVTSGILSKGILINNRGQRELGIIAKNHEPNPLAL